jgi:hypothetical protein
MRNSGPAAKYHETNADLAYALALLRAHRERPCRRTAEHRDELAPSHCSMPPVLSDRKDSTPQLRPETTALRDFDSAMSQLGQMRLLDMQPALAAGPLHPKSGQAADASASPLCADIVAKVFLHW